MSRLVRCAVTGLALVVTGPACIGGGADADASTFVVKAVRGVAEVREDPEMRWRGLRTGDQLSTGHVLRVAESARLTLTRAERTTVEVRPHRGNGEITITSPDVITVAAGDVLVANDPVAPVEVRSGDVSARSARGTFRVDRRLSLRVGMYEGDGSVGVFDEDLDVPALSEGIVAGRSLPRAAEPLAYTAADEWDRKLLADVLALDAELQTAARGFVGEYGGRLPTSALLLPLARDAGRADASFVDGSLSTTAAGDVLIGAVFAFLLEAGKRGEAGALYQELLDELDRGATWGLLAKGHDVVDELSDATVRAIGLLTGVVTPGEGEQIRPTSRPTSRPTTGGTRTPSPTPTRSRTPSPSPSPSPSQSPPPPPPCGEIDELLGNC